MGQDFVIASPSLQEALGWEGKLGEILFDGSAKSLVKLLAVPVRPVSAVQSRFKESVEREEGPFLDNHQSAKRKRADSLDGRPAELGKKQKLCNTTISKPGQIKVNSAEFSGLAAEVHDLIFENLDIEDVLSLSLANRYFWSVGREHIQTFYMSFLGPWAGESIICLGANVEAGDNPPELFTEDEEHQQLKDDKEKPGTLYDYAEEFAQITPVTDNFYLPLLDKIREHDVYKHYHRMLDADRSDVWETANPRVSQFYPSDRPWILRNLTTREYVRSEVIALKPEYIQGPSIGGIGFGEVVLSRICWSSDPSVNMEYNINEDSGNIHRGVWAGHCFDITTRARHEQDVKEEWKDVSDEVAKEMASIWKSEYGEDWRRIVTEKCRP